MLSAKPAVGASSPNIFWYSARASSGMRRIIHPDFRSSSRAAMRAVLKSTAARCSGVSALYAFVVIGAAVISSVATAGRFQWLGCPASLGAL